MHPVLHNNKRTSDSLFDSLVNFKISLTFDPVFFLEIVWLRAKNAL